MLFQTFTCEITHAYTARPLSGLNTMSRLMNMSVVLLAIAILSLSDTAVSGAREQSEWRTATKQLLEQSVDVLGRSFPKANLATVVIFVKPGCPLVDLYSKRLLEMSSTYDDRGLRFMAVAVGQEAASDTIEHWAISREVHFKVIHDTGALRDHFEAAISPEAFILDHRYDILYRGRIDDQFKPGRPPFSHPFRNDLADRLALLANEKGFPPSFTFAEGCHLQSREISFNIEIAPLIYRKCTPCHRPHDIQAQLPLTTYAEIADWAPTISARVQEGYMPPWRAHPSFGTFSNDASLTVNERWRLTKWIHDGMPCEPAPDSAPDHLVGSEWRFGEPDAVIGMLPEGDYYTIAKDGVLPYQHFEVTSPFDEDKWVLATEVRPGAPEVVHHVNVFLLPPDMEEGFLSRVLKRRGADMRFRNQGKAIDSESLGRLLDIYGYKLEKRVRFLSDYNPAEPVTRFPQGKGIRLPKGSRFVFEIHYTPNGYSSMKDRTLIAFQFGDAIPKDWQAHEPITRVGGKMGELNISPGNHLSLSFDLPILLDADLHSLKPHMHYRGKSFRAALVSPGVASHTILYIPTWDYDFQMPYLFDKPVFMPRGSVLRLTYDWDNSANNPFISKAQTKEHVRFGLQTDEEMCLSFPTYTYRTTDLGAIHSAEKEVTRSILEQVKLP